MDIKRKAFIDKNSCWIDFLNDYNTGELEKCNEIHLKEKEEKNILDLSKMSEELKALQSHNLILQADSNTNVTGHRFYSEKDLMMELAKWMYLNLKAISRNETQDFIYTEKVDFILLEALMRKITTSFLNLDRNGGYYCDFTIYSYIPEMATMLHLFLLYIQEIKKGLNEKSKLGIYKIGVCPYKKLKEKKECGKVFVGEKYNQRACKLHFKKYQAMKRDHRKKSHSC